MYSHIDTIQYNTIQLQYNSINIYTIQFNGTLDEIRIIKCWVKKKEQKTDQH